MHTEKRKNEELPSVSDAERERLESRFNVYAEEVLVKLEEALDPVWKIFDQMPESEKFYFAGGVMGALALQLGKAKFHFVINSGQTAAKIEKHVRAQILEHVETGLAREMKNFLTSEKE